MSDLDRNYASPFGRAAGRIDAATVDAGLRAYMLRIYNYMSIGLALTGLAALGLYGYTTKRDMSGMGSFLIMGLFGIIIASLVNLFLASSMLQFVVSVVGVLVFAGLTAWDTQRLKNDYIYGYASQGGDVAERAAITGALSLYLNFINLFTLLLQLLGQRD